MDDAQIKEMVRARYGGIAEAAADAACCGPATSCCGDVAPGTPTAKSRDMGYSETELAAVPEGANLGPGCGNPQAIAAMRSGEVALDLAVVLASTVSSQRNRLDKPAGSSAST